MPIYESINELVGNTPMVRFQYLNGDEASGAEILLKLESFNPLSSVKDRIGLAMVRAAEADGSLAPGAPIVEATSGNTGIALAFIGAATGHPVILTMPDTMSIERRRLLKAFGAQLVLTPGAEGMTGAVRRAEEIHAETAGAFMTRQFENSANPESHRQTTAEEIWRDCDGSIDVFVAGVGTGGTLAGAGSRLKELNPDISLVAVEPESSPVLSGGAPGPHRIQGIGAGFVPAVLDPAIIDEIVMVSAEHAGAASRRLAAEQGILAGISAGANVSAALEIARRPENAGKRIVTIICDTGERYLSTWLFDE
jgi:cysteine synthase A